MTATLPDVPGLRKAGNAVHRRVLELAARLGLSVDHVCALIAHESGWRANAENPQTKATGLIQFMPKTARGIGTSVTALKAMTALEQLDWVEKFFARSFAKQRAAGEAISPRDVAMAGLGSSFIGLPDDHVAYVRGQLGYNLNATLDRNQNGELTLGEVRDDIDRMLIGRKRFDVEGVNATPLPTPPATPSAPSSPPSSSSPSANGSSGFGLTSLLVLAAVALPMIAKGLS
jgi:hypothetical protein